MRKGRPTPHSLLAMPQLALLLALAGCGGGGNSLPAENVGPPAVTTLAYVVNQCSEDAQGQRSFQQSLRILHGESAPVTVMVLSYPPASLPPGICALYGSLRQGETSVVAGAFQRLGILGDASGVVFEVTDAFSFFAPNQLLPPEQESSIEGIYFVRADGGGLRRLSTASGDPAFRLFVDLSSPSGFTGHVYPFLPPSPDGRAVAFTDYGPGPTGEETIQVFTLEIATGRRFQVTQLPPAAEPAVSPFTTTAYPNWISDQRLTFFSFSNPEGLNPDGEGRDFAINADGTGLQLLNPLPVALPGSQIVPNFQITSGGSGATVLVLNLPGAPSNHIPGFDDTITELFLVDGDNLLQLTNFRRVDVGASFFLRRVEQRVVFSASADPFGTNPSENCQWFSIDTTGSDLRQLTHFSQGDHSSLGCSAGPPPGCMFNILGNDPETGATAFASSCDPFGTNPNGEQLFIMRSDGTGLRQLTELGGTVTAADGSVTVELPGPFVSIY